VHRTDTIIRRFSARLLSLRTERNLSQEALASAARLHPNFIGALERGTKQPSLTTLESLAKGLKVGLPTLVSFQEHASSKTDRAQEEMILLNQRLQQCNADEIRRIRKAIEALLQK
jgi:transcriptional regulator with XRE-family HTH domain